MSQAAAVGYDDLKKLIREVPNWPKPGILFYDITTLLKNQAGFHRMLDAMAAEFRGRGVELVLGIEARGFIFAAALADRLSAGFVPVRKPNKLPAEKTSLTYQLEYGTDTLEVHTDAIQRGQKVLIADDLLATGGTAAACVSLASKMGADIVGIGFAIELTFLHGRDKLQGQKIFSLLKYDS